MGYRKETWVFSVIDVIEILTGSTIPKRYWSDLKKKLTKEGSKLYENIVQLKFEAADGKKVVTNENFLPPGKEKKRLK